jgi:hypothetical protein
VILKEYDIGWGQNWPTKQLEQQLVKSFVGNHYSDQSRSVIINGVWYSDEYHRSVMAELRELRPTHVFVVSMLDPPIIKLQWFEELACKIIGIGYYPGTGFLDYFAMFTEKFHQVVDQDLLLDADQIDTAYMCLNRKPHPHRLQLYQALSNLNLLDRGFVSMGGIPPLRLLGDNVKGQHIAPNPGAEQYGIENDIATLGNLNRWQRHLVNIVTETVWDIEPSNFLSEKTFKPILGLRPFLIYVPNGGIECLLSRGIEPYVGDFNDITDADLTQSYNIPVFIDELCKQNANYYKMKFTALKEKLLYNREQFNKHVTKQKRIL